MRLKFVLSLLVCLAVGAGGCTVGAKASLAAKREAADSPTAHHGVYEIDVDHLRKQIDAAIAKDMREQQAQQKKALAEAKAKGDPMAGMGAQMGEAFGKMAAGMAGVVVEMMRGSTVTLESGGAASVTVLGMTQKGKYTRDGSSIILDFPEAAGKEAKPGEQTVNASFTDSPMEFDPAAGTLTVVDEKQGMDMVFRRKKPDKGT